MAASSVKFPALLALMLAARANCAAHVQANQPIDLDAQSFYTDGTNNVVFRRVRITQGAMSISADLGQGQSLGPRPASGLDFDNSLWTFRGNVKITLTEGQLNADEAQITFSRQQLSKATANGKQAAFEGQLEKTGKVAHGRADTIDYDAASGVVRLLNNAWLSYGETELRGDSLKYNVGQSITAEGVEPDSQRVHITITPPPPRP
jgi:lipopolysaccharide transport protein LptA